MTTSWPNRILYATLATFAVANTKTQNKPHSEKPNDSQNTKRKRHYKIARVVTFGKFMILIFFKELQKYQMLYLKLY